MGTIEAKAHFQPLVGVLAANAVLTAVLFGLVGLVADVFTKLSDFTGVPCVDWDTVFSFSDVDGAARDDVFSLLIDGRSG